MNKQTVFSFNRYLPHCGHVQGGKSVTLCSYTLSISELLRPQGIDMIDVNCAECDAACDGCTGPGPENCQTCRARHYSHSGVCKCMSTSKLSHLSVVETCIWGCTGPEITPIPTRPTDFIFIPTHPHSTYIPLPPVQFFHFHWIFMVL